MNFIKIFPSNNNIQKLNIIDGINGTSFDFFDVLFLIIAYINHNMQLIIMYINIKFIRLNQLNHILLFQNINGKSNHIVVAK